MYACAKKSAAGLLHLCATTAGMMIDKLLSTNPENQHHTFKPDKNFPNSKLPLFDYKNACSICLL
jgi:hypothetical protein